MRRATKVAIISFACVLGLGLAYVAAIHWVMPDPLKTATGPREADVQRIYQIRRRLAAHWAQTGTLPADLSALLSDGPMGPDYNGDALGGHYAFVVSPDGKSVRVTSSGRGGYSIVGEFQLKDRSGSSDADVAPWSKDPLNDVSLPGELWLRRHGV